MEVSAAQIVKYALGGATVFIAIGILMVYLVTKRMRKLQKNSEEAKYRDPETIDEDIQTESKEINKPSKVVAFYKIQQADKRADKAFSMEENLKIGRCAEENDWVIEDDPTISHKHCCIEQREDKLYIIDLNSKNGTYVNDRRVEGAYVLENHDKIRMGKSEYRIVF